MKLLDANVVLPARPTRAGPGEPGPHHERLLLRECESGEATADLMPDAVLAALGVEHGAEVVSFDRDFGRFPDVRWSRPEV